MSYAAGQSIHESPAPGIPLIHSGPPGEPDTYRPCVRIEASQPGFGRRGILLFAGLALAAFVPQVAEAFDCANTSAAAKTANTASTAAFDRAFSSLSARLHDLTPSGRAATRAFLTAAERWDLERVRELATGGEPNVNARSDSAGWTALFFAVYADDLPTVRVLLNRGADVNIHENESGSVALAAGDHLLVRGGAPLKYARSAEVAKQLLAHGALIDARDADGDRAIHWSSPQVTALLLDAGADPNSRQGAVRNRGITYPGDATTALMTASRRGHSENVRLLIAAGADVNAQGRWRSTALHSATDAASQPLFNGGRPLEVIQILVAAGANVNARDSNGQTALMIAARSRSTEVIKALLAAGADTSICDAESRNAADHFESSRCDGPECLAIREQLSGRGKGHCTVFMPLPEPLPTPWTMSSLFGWTQAFVLLSLPAIFICSLIISWMVVRRSRSRRLAQTRIAHLAYAVCALIVTLFELLLFVEGPDVYWFLGVLLVLPLAIAGAVAVAMSVAVRPNTGLSVLAGATLALGGLQLLALFGGLIGTWMNVIAWAYVMLVLCVIVYGRRSWLRAQ